VLDLLFRFPRAFDANKPAGCMTDHADVLLRSFVDFLIGSVQGAVATWLVIGM